MSWPGAQDRSGRRARHRRRGSTAAWAASVPRARVGWQANGLRSIEAHLGTDQYPRLRVGVERGDGRRDLGDHVLARFEPDERVVIDEAVSRAADAMEAFIDAGIEVVMNRYIGRKTRKTKKNKSRYGV